MRGATPLLVLAFLTSSHAIGLQHGLFSSQATQGPTWQGTAAISKERFVITVNPDYLDVELEWEFEVGGTKPEQFEKALEIVGNVNFERGSTVMGMLVWYKDMILKAKLKTTAHARKEYEEVVDRNSPVPPRPRDPVLLEKIAEDNYDISIFPVEWGGTRKVRIRYLVPSMGMRMGYPHAFTDKARVFLKKGPGVESIGLETDLRATRFGSPMTELNPSEFNTSAYEFGVTKERPRYIRPVLTDSPSVSRIYLTQVSGALPGSLAHIYFRQPAVVTAKAKEVGATAMLSALLKSASDSCRKSLFIDASGKGDADELRIYSKDPLIGKIIWNLSRNKESVQSWEEVPRIIRVEEGAQYARTFGMVDFYPMSPTMPRSLGVNLGFIDKWYSLVALEKDALTASVARTYVEGGVPALEPIDIFPEKDEVLSMSTDAWLNERGLTRESLLMPSFHNYPVGLNPEALPRGLRYSIQGGMLVIEFDAELLRDSKSLEVSIHSLDGKMLRKWDGSDLRAGRLTWSPAEKSLAAGVFMLRVRLGARMYSESFRIPR